MIYLRFIFLDTNNWIYLANGFNVLSKDHDDLHLKVFDIIERRADDGSFTFLVNDIILEEFDRNKVYTEDRIKKIENQAASFDQQLKAIKGFAASAAEETEALRIRIREAAVEKVAIQRAHIAKVERFLKTKTKKIAITNETKIEAAEMAMAKKAPFIGDKKNSMSDAVILLSSVAYIRDHGRIDLPFDGFAGDNGYFTQSYFVSSNTGDFSHPQHKERIHPDLEPLLAPLNIRYYHNLNPLINSLNQELLTIEEEAWIEAAEEFSTCPTCHYEHTGLDFKPVTLIDPHLLGKDSNDPTQIDLFSGHAIRLRDPYVRTRTARCENCEADYIICVNCKELVHLETINEVTECEGCSYQYMLRAETDHNGRFCMEEFHIVVYDHCRVCGEALEILNNERICSTCNYYRVFPA